MHRIITRSLRLALTATVALALIGCDESPTSVNDFEIQPALEMPSSLSLVLTGESGTAEFEVSYQGLDGHPQAEATGDLTVEKVDQTGTPKNGDQQWAATYSQSVSGVVREAVVIRSASGNEEIIDSLQVTVSPFAISNSFTADLAAVEDYENGQRAVTTSGGTEATFDSTTVPGSSTGIASLRIDGTPSGSATIERQANAPNSDRFAFLVRPSPDTDFTLTLTFTEETGGGTATHQIEVPVRAGQQWREYEIAFPQIGEDFDPVAPRAGGSGAFLSVEMSADQNVTYHVDELAFASADAAQVDIHDFEKTTLAYGVFSDISFSNSDDVGEQSDGPTARSLSYTTGGNFFGYNYDGLRVDASGGGMLSLHAGRVSRAFKLFVFVETPNGAGGYNFDNGIEVPIEAGSQWRTINIPLSDLGSDPSALASGIDNVGFEIRRADGDDTTEPIEVLLDDIVLRAGN